jgi:CBS domain-containing protein
LALERMGASGVEILPVVSRADVHQVLGVVTLRDVLAAYGVGADARGLRPSEHANVGAGAADVQG